MAEGDHLWAPGQSGNPNGRPKGSRNKRTQEIFEVLEGRGDKDPIDYLSEVVTGGTDEALRITAANYLLPYKHSKRSSAPTPRFIETPVTVPAFHSVQEAEAYLAHLPVLLGKGELDSQSALELSTLTKNWLDALYARQEYDLKLQAQGGGSEQTITITGGLPRMPGHEGLIMPGDDPNKRLNGHNSHGPVIEHADQPAIESPQSEVPEP
jgi:Family of unknown function (DUF5681)